MLYGHFRVVPSLLTRESAKSFMLKSFLVLSKNETHLPLKTEGFVSSEVAYYSRGPFLDKFFFVQGKLARVNAT